MGRGLKLTVACVLLLSSAFAGCLVYDDDPFMEIVDEEYAVDEGTVVDVVCASGDVDITAWTGENVTLHAEVLDQVDVVGTLDAGLLLIETVFGEDAHDVSVQITVQVPVHTFVGNVTTQNGMIQLTGTRGNSTLTSSNGWITVDDVDGFIEATSVNGRIEIHRTTGIRNITATNADINIEVHDLPGNTTITTSNSAIVVNIRRDVDATVRMTTQNGLIDFHEELLTTTLVQTSRVEGVMGEGGDTLTISTVNGDIYFYMLL